VPSPLSLAVVSLAALVVLAPARALVSPRAPVASGPRAGDLLAASACEPGTLPDGDACVRLPGDDDGAGPDPLVAVNAHRERSGNWSVYDQIPRRPERPPAYEAYRYPVEGKVVSGYDLDRPDPMQRRGPTLRATGHGGVDIPRPKGTLIKMLALEHQRGDAEVVYTGALFGTTVVTRHAIAEGGELRDYLLLFGHLDGAAPGVAAGARLADGDLVGFVGDTGSPELVHLHLEARRVQAGVDAAKVPPARLLAPEVSIVCDPRNVLPLR